jgi:hypothetical protein
MAERDKTWREDPPYLVLVTVSVLLGLLLCVHPLLFLLFAAITASLMSGRTRIRLVCTIWLFIITPVFGVIPLMATLGMRPPLFKLELAILRGFWTVFINDPEPGFEDTGLPLSEIGWWLMISITLGVAIIALVYCLRGRRDEHPSAQNAA